MKKHDPQREALDNPKRDLHIQEQALAEAKDDKLKEKAKMNKRLPETNRAFQKQGVERLKEKNQGFKLVEEGRANNPAILLPETKDEMKQGLGNNKRK